MNRQLSVLFILTLSSLFALGCSGGMDVVAPGETGENIPYSTDTDLVNNSNRSLIGSWIMTVDPETMTFKTEDVRMNSAHINVTSFVPVPSITFNSYNPYTDVLDVDLTISNSSPFDGYDVRLIIFTDAVGHKLTNADEWTGFYDIAGGLPINPFKAYAKMQSNRIFEGQSQHTENLKIVCPDGNFSVHFAIDASFPGNCTEPFQISGFTQDELGDTAGASADIELTVLDWQDDVSTVNLYCPAITGVPLVSLYKISGNSWGRTLVNSIGTVPGEYTGYLLAMSSNSGDLTLYDEVIITVTKAAAIEPVGNVTLTVNRMPLDHGINVSAPWRLNWDAVPGAAEYAVYYDYEPTNPDYFFLVGTVSGTQTVYNVPASHLPPNHLVRGYTYIVRARAIAGDPSSESVDSEHAFITVSCFDTMSNRDTLDNNRLNREGWTTAVERTPYAVDTLLTYWPYVGAQSYISSPYSLSIVPTYLGAAWTSGTGNPSDNYPGKLIAITRETPVIPDSTVRRIEFVGTCIGTWDCDDEGGVAIGSLDSPSTPMDGWNGSDFRWAKADGATLGMQQYNYRNANVTYPFPWDMQDYVPANYNCWRWVDG